MTVLWGVRPGLILMTCNQGFSYMAVDFYMAEERSRIAKAMEKIKNLERLQYIFQDGIPGTVYKKMMQCL